MPNIKINFNKMNGNDKLKSFKAIILGFSFVGKTSLIDSYYGFEFKEDVYNCTIGNNFYNKEIKFKDLTYSINIWDTPGCEMFIDLLKQFFKNTHIFILVFDMTNKKSFLYLDKLLEAIELHTDINKAMFVLIGNKSDRYDKWEIKESDAKKFADIIHAKFFLSSVKNEPERFRQFLDGVFQDYIKLYYEGSDLLTK